MEKTYTEEEIKKDLETPFDYGSPEYLKVRDKILQNREAYRREKEVQSIIQYKYLKEGLDK